MGFFDKLFGSDEDERPRDKPEVRERPEVAKEKAETREKVDGNQKEKADGNQKEKADGKKPEPAPAAAGRAPEPEDDLPPEPPADVLGAGIRVPREVRMLVASIVHHIERTSIGVEHAREGMQTLIGMVQAVAKSASRSEVDRKQQFLDLRAHITMETDRLIQSMQDEARGEASVAVFRALLPALDEVDHVLRENEAGAEVRAESVRIVRRRLRDALSRMGIEEVPISPRETVFDAEMHEGRPYEGEAEAVKGLAPHVIVDVERNGWTGLGRVLRHALVTVVKE